MGGPLVLQLCWSQTKVLKKCIKRHDGPEFLQGTFELGGGVGETVWESQLIRMQRVFVRITHKKMCFLMWD